MRHNYLNSILLSLVLTLTFATHALSQTEVAQAGIRIKSMLVQDQIYLRWSVDDPSAWIKANKSGFVLKRYTIARNGLALTTSEEKTIGLFKPRPLEQWKEIVARNDNAAIVAQAIYGNNFDVELGKTKSNSLQNIVNRAKESEQRFVFALIAADTDFETACFAGWGYTDKDIKPNERYLYVIESSDPIINIKKTSVLIDATSDLQTLPPPMDFNAVFQDKRVALFWDYVTLADTYFAYDIERSEDGSVFKKVNKAPVANTDNVSGVVGTSAFYVDSLPENGKKFFYRIKGKTIFGQYSSYSNIVSGSGKQSLQVAPAFTKCEFTEDGILHLFWDFPIESENSILYFDLLYSEDDTPDSYKIILPALKIQQREATVKISESSGYIKLRAVSGDTEIKESLALLIQMVDNTPPSTPSGLAGDIDDNGVVRIKWTPNTENDIAGYYVFRASRKNDEGVRLTPQPITYQNFTDSVSLKTLDFKVYYGVVAVDKRKNESKISEQIELQKPDKIKPQSPSFTAYEVKDKAVELKWNRSYSEDVFIHLLYRKASDDGDSGWKLVFQTKEIKSEYIYNDKDIIPGKVYNYKLNAVDRGGLLSISSPEISISYDELSIEDPIVAIASYPDKNNKRIELNWRLKSSEITEILVYKQIGDRSPNLWRTLSGSQNFVVDEDLQSGIRYTYILKVMLKSLNPTKTKKIIVDF
jgi:fibronectin type 3 domain-containing protein